MVIASKDSGIVAVEKTTKPPVRRVRNIADRQFQHAASELRSLAVAVDERKPLRRAFERAEVTLAALPLSPNDFVVARGRLRHAKRLMWQGELSAATVELRLIADCIYTETE